MRKIIFLCLSLLTTIGLSAKQLYVGNRLVDGGGDTGSDADTIGVAVLVPAAELAHMHGADITTIALRHGCTVNSSEGVSYLKVFIAEKLNGEFLYEQEVDSLDIVKRWNKIVLDQPFNISGDSIYIGYFMQASNTFASYNDNEEGVKSYVHMTSRGGWADSDFPMCVYGVVEGDNLPANDAVLLADTKLEDMVAGEPSSASFTIKNNGTDTIKSFKASYRVGNGMTEFTTFDNLKVPYLKSYSFTIEDIMIANSGQYDIEFAVSEVNGVVDDVPTDNSISMTVNVVERPVERKVLFEIFSTERCRECPKGHEKIAAALKGNDHVVSVSHHVGFYTDQWTLPSDQDYMYFYQTDITYAPAGNLDRTNWKDAGAIAVGGIPSPAPNFSVLSSDLESLVDEAMAKPAYAKIRLDVTYRDSVIVVNVKGNEVVATNATSPRVTVFITEDNLNTTKQVGWDYKLGSYYQHHVNRAVLTDTWGDAVDIAAGFDKNYQIKIDKSWNEQNLNVVAFVHNYDAVDFNNCRVYNAEEVQLIPHTVDVDDTDAPSVYVISRPNGLFEIVGDYTSANVYSVNGNKIATLRGSPSFDACNWARGLYILELLLPDGSINRVKVLR